MSQLTTSATIEIATDAIPSAKTQHLLRRRLEEALEEAVHGVLAEFDIENQFARAVRVDELEIEDTTPHEHVD